MGVTKSLSILEFQDCLLGTIEVLDLSNIKFVNNEILVVPKFISKVVLVLKNGNKHFQKSSRFQSCYQIHSHLL